MADFWIVTDHRYVRHFDIEKARTEQSRLGKLHPEAYFRLMRCKTYMEPGRKYFALEQALREIAPERLAEIEREYDAPRTPVDDTPTEAPSKRPLLTLAWKKSG